VKDSEKVISELARILKNKGELLISVPHPRSEKMCILLEPSYYGLGMHLRVFDLSLLQALLKKNCLRIFEVRNDDFFSALALTYRLIRKMPFEIQSGYTLEKDIILLFIQLLACLSDPPSWTILRLEMRKRGLLRLYYPVLRLGGAVRLFEVIMSRIYPKTMFIKALKLEKNFNGP
jgi:SAM-dependent methyltransferase